MTRKIHLVICFVLISVLGRAQDTSPNILLIISDQHSGTVMNQTGYEHVNTPGIDELAAQGVTFTRSYCTFPDSEDSRQSLMTGMMPSQIVDVTNYSAIGKSLSDAGYETAYYGKWHVGSSDIDDAKDWHGFETYADSYDDTEISGWSTDFIKQTHSKPFFMVTSFVNPEDCGVIARNLSGNDESYNDGDVGALTVDVSLCPSLPSNFAIAENEPEGVSGRRNQDAGDEYWDTNPYKLWTDTEWRRYMWGYDRLVEKVDAHIQEVYNELDAQGLLENTIIIFTSDHGDGHASHQWTQKMTFYEETVNTPFIISWKGKTKAGVIDNTTLISNGLDIVPTILEIAGVTVPSTLTGANVLPNALQSPGADPLVDRDYVVSEVGQEIYKSNTPSFISGRMVVTEKFKYCLFSSGANNEQLFDLENDPDELNAVTYNPAYNDELMACREMLIDWVEKTNDDFNVDAGIAVMKYAATRLNNGQAIITEEMFTNVGATEDEGINMNGPSVIHIPDWIAAEDRADPTANYYCYFAHHIGEYIRMAWAEEIGGPWNLYQIGSDVAVGNRGVLDNGDADINLDNGIVIENNHLASPNAHVDHENQRIILYFHTGSSTFVDGEEVNSQVTYVSHSPYGLDFYDNIQSVFLGSSYFSVFEYDGYMYALDNGATPNRALDAENPWEAPAGFDFTNKLWDKLSFNPFQNAITENTGLSSGDLRVRHTGTKVVGDELHVLYSRRGDLMENIQMSTIDLSVGDWTNWEASYPPTPILMAQPGWEGGQFSTIHSETSASPENVNQLRDPYIFTDEDGELYVFYTGCGEDAIGVASLTAAHSEVTTSIALKDAHVAAGSSSDINYGAESEMFVVNGTDQDLAQKAYVSFDLSDTIEVDKAIVRLYASSTASCSISVYETTDDWTEGDITWTNAPVIGELISTTQVDTLAQYYEWDITSYVVDNLGASISIVFNDESASGAMVNINSKEGANTPELLLITENTYHYVPPTKPSNPTLLIANAASSSEIIIDWADQAFTENGYTIERKSGDAAFSELATLDANSKSYKDAGLDASATYTYRVQAFNDIGKSDYSNEASATTFSAESIIIAYNASDDTYVKGGSNSSENYGSESTIEVKTGSSESYFRRGLVKFDLNDVLWDADDVGNAIVRIYANAAGACTLTASEIDDNWDELSVTWASAPVSGNAVSEVEVSADGQYYEWNVTEYLKSQVLSDNILSLCIEDLAASNVTVKFASKEAGTNVPELVIRTVGAIEEGTSIFEVKDQLVNIYPNPINGNLLSIDLVGFESTEDVDISIISMQGQVVYHNRSNESATFTIDTHNMFTKGIYIVSVKSGESVITKKLIVQ